MYAVPPGSTPPPSPPAPPQRLRLTPRSVSAGASLARQQVRRAGGAVAGQRGEELRHAQRRLRVGPWPMARLITSLGVGLHPNRFSYHSLSGGEGPVRSPGRSTPVAREKPRRVPSASAGPAPARSPAGRSRRCTSSRSRRRGPAARAPRLPAARVAPRVAHPAGARDRHLVSGVITPRSSPTSAVASFQVSRADRCRRSRGSAAGGGVGVERAPSAGARRPRTGWGRRSGASTAPGPRPWTGPWPRRRRSSPPARSGGRSAAGPGPASGGCPRRPPGGSLLSGRSGRITWPRESTSTYRAPGLPPSVRSYCRSIPVLPTCWPGPYPSHSRALQLAVADLQHVAHQVRHRRARRVAADGARLQRQPAQRPRAPPAATPARRSGARTTGTGFPLLVRERRITSSTAAESSASSCATGASQARMESAGPGSTAGCSR